MQQNRGILVPRVLALITDHETEGSGVENESSFCQIPCIFRELMAWKNHQICVWNDDAALFNRPMVGDDHPIRLRKQRNLQENERSLQHATGK